MAEDEVIGVGRGQSEVERLVRGGGRETGSLFRDKMKHTENIDQLSRVQSRRSELNRHAPS